MLILFAGCGLLSCAEEPLPRIRPTEATVVAAWEVPDSKLLHEELVRAYRSDGVSAVPAVYGIRLCEYDESKERCRLYDPPRSFFRRFKGEGLPIFASYGSRPRRLPDRQRLNVVQDAGAVGLAPDR